MSKDFEGDSDDEVNLLSDEKILELAQGIDTEVIQNKLLSLYGIKIPLNATIEMKKLDFLF